MPETTQDRFDVLPHPEGWGFLPAVIAGFTGKESHLTGGTPWAPTTGWRARQGTHLPSHPDTFYSVILPSWQLGERVIVLIRWGNTIRCCIVNPNRDFQFFERCCLFTNLLLQALEWDRTPTGCRGCFSIPNWQNKYTIFYLQFQPFFMNQHACLLADR